MISSFLWRRFFTTDFASSARGVGVAMTADDDEVEDDDEEEVEVGESTTLSWYGSPAHLGFFFGGITTRVESMRM